MKKKLLSILTIMMLLLNIMPLSIIYATDPSVDITITADKTEVKAGDEVTFTINVKATGLCSSAYFELAIPEGLTYVEGSGEINSDLASTLSSTTIQEFEYYETEKALIIATAYMDLDFSTNPEVVTFKCTLDDTAEGSYTVGVENIDFSDENIEVIASSYITVTEATVTVIIPETGVTVSSSEVELNAGESATLTATVTPSNATDTSVTWSSSDTSVAKVSSSGKITAVGKGTATITATTANGYTATCDVTVTQPITGVSLNKASLDLEKGDTETLTASIEPSNADGDTTITWSSSDTSVATVSEDGVVTAVGKGNATITATTSNGYTDTCNVTVGVTLKSISLDVTEKTLTKTSSSADTCTLTVEYNPADTDSNKTITWTSTDTSVATVSENGVVTAVGAGETTIKAATVNGLTATCVITVEIPLTSISIKTDTSIEYAQTEQLIVTYVEADTTEDKTIAWSSSDENIATISSDGTITGVGVGTATITAETANGLKATCEVTVTPVELESISIKQQNVTLAKGINDSETLTVTYNPENTTDDTTVTWTSSDSSIVSVDENGTITALKKGTATITATVGEKTATTDVTVTVPLQSISLNETETTLELTETQAETVNLSVTYNPSETETTDDTTVTWSSTDTNVVTVDDNGLVTAVGAGTAYVKAKVGDLETSCKITVEIPLTGIEASVSETEIIKGQTNQVTVTLEPADTTYSGTITYTSSNEAVATVNSNGLITAVSAGNATITVSAVYNGVTFTKTVEVSISEIALNSIAIDTTDFDLQIGSTEQLSIIYSPENTTDDKTVTWTSSDTSVATVDENGLVTAVSEGTATITATVGDKTTTVEVTVTKVPITSISLDETSSEIEVGETLDVKVTVNPSNATYDSSDFTYTSSNSDVLYVSEDGTIIAVGAGTAILTVETEDGIKSQIEITVVNSSATNDETDNSNETDETDENEEETTVNDTTSLSVLPYTGDMSVEILVALMVVSGIGIAAIIIKRNKRN